MKRIKAVRIAAYLLAFQSMVACGGGGVTDPSIETGETRQGIQLAFVAADTGMYSGGFAQVLTTGSSPAFGNIREPGNCGSTFISKHYAITAAHCVNSVSYPEYFGLGKTFTVEMIDTTNLNFSTVQSAATVAGGPALSQYTLPNTGQLTPANGYHVTPLTCSVTYRCFSTILGYGERNCPPISDSRDVALIHCPDRASPNYLQVSPLDPTSGNVIVDWFHEVLNLDTDSTHVTGRGPAGNWDNYGSYYEGESDSDNYHYEYLSFKYLPLQFKNWLFGVVPYKIVAHYSPTPPSTFGGMTMTDVPACHGTSGSGTYINGTSALLGPVLEKGPDWNTNTLCEDMTTIHVGGSLSTFLSSPYARALEADSLVSGDR